MCTVCKHDGKDSPTYIVVQYGQLNVSLCKECHDRLHSARIDGKNEVEVTKEAENE